MPNEQSITDKVLVLSGDDREGFHEHIKDAIFHLASCWDSLRACESILDGVEIETDDIQSATGEVSDPTDAYAVELTHILGHLEVSRG